MSRLWLLIKRWARGDLPILGQRAKPPSVTGVSPSPAETEAWATSDMEAEGTKTAGIWSIQASNTLSTEPIASSTSAVALTDYHSSNSMSTSTLISTPSPVPTASSTCASATSTKDTASTEAGALSITTGSTNTKLAISLPIAIVGLLIIIGLIFFYLRRRRQRNAQSAYHVGASESKAVPTSELMSVPKRKTPEHATRSPTLDVPNNNSPDSSPGSPIVRSSGDANTELGLVGAPPTDQRTYIREHDMPGTTTSPLVNENIRSAARFPFQSWRDDDVVSLVSERRSRKDYDDMSSVSSLNDSLHDDHNTHPVR